MHSIRMMLRILSITYFAILLIPLGIASLYFVVLGYAAQMSPLEVLQSQGLWLLPAKSSMIVLEMAAQFGLFWCIPVALFLLKLTSSPGVGQIADLEDSDLVQTDNENQ